jgi:16S rRNA (cytosine1402-N4)-methyltransferase
VEILRHLKKGRLIAFDQDEDARLNIPDDDRFLFLDQNFRFLKNNLLFNGISSIDGLIADLGVSFHQFDEPERGFTFRQNSLLDMRMNRQNPVTASDILMNSEEEKLADIFFRYGELTNSRKLAHEIVIARQTKKIATVEDLTGITGKYAPFRQEHKFYAKLFQSLRIAVNHEIEYLQEMLEQSLSMLKSGGRLVVISYHSLEDRIVKNFMKTGNFDGEEKKDFFGNVERPFLLISKKGISPDEEEVQRNNRARSARLRIAEKI